jgi:amidophosphoribosyltransferase
MTKDEVQEFIEADSLEYLSIDNLKESLGRDTNYSMLSFDGDYFVV